MRRAPAAQIEALVAKSVRERLALSEPMDDRAIIKRHVARVEVQRERLIVELAGTDAVHRECAIQIPWRKATGKRCREILVPEGMPPQHARPIRSETRTLLVASIARGRRWLEELASDVTATAQSIAEREGCSVRKVNMTISLAFLAPNLVKAAIDGRLPHGMGVARLADLPAEWSRQHRILGLPSP
ncbi:MAG: resolvase [Rhodoplanes sp.]